MSVRAGSLKGNHTRICLTSSRVCGRSDVRGLESLYKCYSYVDDGEGGDEVIKSEFPGLEQKIYIKMYKLKCNKPF